MSRQETTWVWNAKENKSERVPINEIPSLIGNPDSGYVPADYDYALQNLETGEFGTIAGSKLRGALDSGMYALRDKGTSQAVASFKDENSFMGVATKQALNEAFTLGINQVDDELKESPWSEELQSAFDEALGGAKTTGTVAGLGGSVAASVLVPFLAPVAATKATSLGVKAGQALSKVKGAKKLYNNAKTVVSNPVGQKLLQAGKVAGEFTAKTPFGSVLNATIKAGDEGAQVAVNLAKQVGVKNTNALNAIQRTSKYATIAAMDGAIFGGREAYRAGKYNPTPEGEFNYKIAMQQGKEVFLDTAMWSAGLLGAFGFGGAAVASVTKSAATKIGNVVGKVSQNELVKTAGKKTARFASGFLNKQFFKTTDSPQKFIKLKGDISHSSEFLSKNLDDNSLKVIVNSMKPEVIKKSGIKNINNMKEVRGKLKDVIKHSDEDGLLTVLREGTLNLERGVIPKTKQNVFDMIEKFRIQIGEKLQSLRKAPTEEFKKAERYGNQVSQKFKEDKYIQDVLFVRSSAVQKQVKEQLIAKDLMQLKTEEGMRNTARKLSQTLKIRSEQDVKKYTGDIERFFKHELKLTDKEAKEAMKMYSRFAKNNQEFISSVTDMEVYRKLVKKKKLSVADMDELDDIVRRNSATKDPLVNPLIGELEDMTGRMIRDSHIPKELRVSKKDTVKIIGLAVKELNSFEKILSGGQAVRKINEVKKILSGSKDKYMSFEDLHNLKSEFSELAKFAKKTDPSFKESVFRNVYGKLSDFETNNFKKLAKNPKYAKSAGELIENKSRYSFAANLTDIMDSAIVKGKGGHFLSPRDGLNFILYGGLGGGFFGGPIGALAGIGIAGVAQGISRTGYGFLSATRRIDTLSDGMARANKFYNNLKNSSKIKGMLSHSSQAGRKTYNASRIAYLMYGRQEQRQQKFEDLANDLKSADPEQIYLSQDMEHYKAINDVGGDQVSSEYTQKMIQIKNMVMQELPKGTTDPNSGKTTYTKHEEKNFYNNVSDFLVFENFFKDFSNGTVSLEQVQKVQNVYPEFYSQMIISVMEALNKGQLKMNTRLQRSLDTIKGNNRAQFFLNLDGQQQMQDEEQVKKQKAGGVKFTTLTQPTSEQRIRDL